MTNFFFITTYDKISGRVISSILNTHPDILCVADNIDTFLPTILQQSNSTLSSTSDISSHTATLTDIPIDKYIAYHSDPQKKYSGSAQHYSAFELQYKTLVEKTVHPYRKVNILLSPALRVNFILYGWSQLNLTPGKLLSFIETQLTILKSKNHNLFNLYNFDYFHRYIQRVASAEPTEILSSVQNKLFLIALAKVIAYDSADIPTASKTYCLEKLLNGEQNVIDLIHYLTNNTLHIPANYQAQILSKLHEATNAIENMQFSPWEPWKTDLLNKVLDSKPQTIFYPHISRPIVDYYTDSGYTEFARLHKHKPAYSKLISLQLNSNRPAQLSAYFNNIEETADNPQDIEVLVNIDIGNTSMKALLEKEITRRKFSLKYIETPKPHSFCDLWQPINKLLEITDPNTYFLLNISDEMLFITPGWDTKLKNYIGYFPDHLFRLRSSRNKYRNYFDRWECSFAQDSIPITTKKWIDVGGNWNPCFGPDSYQQLVSFYLTKESIFSNESYLRDIPITDIQFAGDVPAIGIAEDKRWKHSSDHIKAMEICQSYKMQLEARRRAMLIKAHIYISREQIVNYSIEDFSRKKEIRVVDPTSKTIYIKYNYSISAMSIWFTNYWRRLRFFSYFGDGIKARSNYFFGFAAYLKSRYSLVYLARLKWLKFKTNSLKTIHSLIDENNKIKELLHILSTENKKLEEIIRNDKNRVPDTLSTEQDVNVQPPPMHLYPKITIIIGVLNMEQYIAKAIESVIAQNYPHLELIVIDGGSTDGTLDIIKQYERHITYWRSEKDDGHCDACNKAIRIATGDFIGFLNADDVYDPTILKKVADMYLQEPASRIISCGASIIKNDLNNGPYLIHEISDPDKLRITLKNMMFELSVINARFFHKNIFEEFGEFQPHHADGNYNLANDRHFLIKLALAGIKSAIIPEPLYQYLSHEGSFTFSKKNITRTRYDHLKLADTFLRDKTLSRAQRRIFKIWIKKDTIYLFLYYLSQSKIKNAFSIMVYGIARCGFSWLGKLPITAIAGIYKRTGRIFIK